MNSLGTVTLLQALISFSAGLGLGVLFFGGLRITLIFADRVKHPALLVLGSYLLRLGLLFGGMVLVALQIGAFGLLIATAGITGALAGNLFYAKRRRGS